MRGTYLARPRFFLTGALSSTMNPFRVAGDLSHIVSFIILLHKIIAGKSAAGISLRTQELYASEALPLQPVPIPGAMRLCTLGDTLAHSELSFRCFRLTRTVVFCSRYLDLLWNFSSLYNYALKICFIGASLTIVYVLRFGAPQKASYNPEADAFPIEYLLAPCAVLGVLINQDHWSLFEMIWAFSIYLEAVSILPQLFLLQKQGEVRAAPAGFCSIGVCCARMIFSQGDSHGLWVTVSSHLLSDFDARTHPVVMPPCSNRLRISLRTMWPRSARTAGCTCSTGCTGTLLRTITYSASSG